MKTEELLRYEAEFKAMQEVFASHLLVFDYPGQLLDHRQRLKDGPAAKEDKQEDHSEGWSAV